MHAPQFFILFLLFYRLIINMSKHGEPCKAKYNAGGALFFVIVYAGLLYWGGFFSH